MVEHDVEHRPDEFPTMGEIARRFAREGIDTEIAQTGGGCATMYVAPNGIDSDGFPIYKAAIGPGVYDWTNPFRSTLDPDCSIGFPDGEGEDTLIPERSTPREIVEMTRKYL